MQTHRSPLSAHYLLNLVCCAAVHCLGGALHPPDGVLVVPVWLPEYSTMCLTCQPCCWLHDSPVVCLQLCE
jgi:hypothetical protein